MKGPVQTHRPVGTRRTHPLSQSHVSILALTLLRCKFKSTMRIWVFPLLRLPSVHYRHISTMETNSLSCLT